MSDDLFAEAMAAVAELNPPPDADEAPEAPELPVEAVSAAPAVDPPPELETPAEAIPAPPEAPVPAERFAPRLTKLMEREAAAVTREQKLKELEEKFSQFETEKAALEADRSRFAADPVSYLRRFAPEMKPAELAKALWYEELGEAAPVEHRLSKTERALKQSVEESRAEREQERVASAEAANNAAMEAAHQQYVGALGALSASVPESLPLVKAFSTQDSERVTRGLYRMAQKHARATNGEVATPEQCAQMLEKELSSLQSLLSPPAPTGTPAKQPASAGPASLRNKHTSVQPQKSTPDTEEEMFEEALKAAREVSTRVGV